MTGRIAFRYARRSVLRNPRRSLLSVLGAGVGCAIGLVATAYYNGAADLQVRAASESGAGHIRVVNSDWPATRENSLRLRDPDEVVRQVEATPGLRAMAPRVRATALLALGNRSAGVEILGVVPEAEQVSNRIVSKATLRGRYLATGDTSCVVIGKTLADRLDVEIDDDLMLTLSGRDGIQGAMLRIVGILETGSREIDGAVCHVPLEDLSRLTGHEGIGEVAVLLEDHRLIDASRADLGSRVPEGNAVVTWKEGSPELAANVEGDTGFIRLMSFLIVVVVMLGITSAQLTGVLERRREFGVLTALGMKGRQIAGLILFEAVMVGVGGAVAALIVGTPPAYLIATRGVDMTSFTGGEISFANVLLDPVIYGDFGAWFIGYALAVSVTATLAAALYPAWYAVRTDPASAMRVT